MSATGYSISKTSFLKFEQCQKAFFLYKNHPYLRDKISIDKQLTFNRGHDVGFFAQQLFPGGTDVSLQTKNAIAAAEETAKLISEKVPVIYEATFLFNGVLIMVDILTLTDEKYTGYEVKSSMKISENYLKDAYLQYYVLKNSLPGFDDLFLVTLNPDYKLTGDIEPKKLFRRRSVKIKAEENFKYFEHQINAAHVLLEKNAIPDIPIGKQCFRPYQCDYFGSCWKNDTSESSIFNLPFVNRDKLFEWHNSGLKNIDQLTDAHLEKEILVKIRRSFLDKEPIIDRTAISKVLSKMVEPAIVMDMEVWSAAIPQIEGTRCFEQVPFLVSFFDGKNHTWHFSEHRGDERETVASQLILMTADYKSVVVYDKNLEVGVINSLIGLFPGYRQGLEELKTKLVDIFDVFLNLSYYDPAFKSNFSLKVVSSILLPEVSYSKISSGLEAMNYYERYRQNQNPLEKETIRNDLVDYCNTDCEATYKLIGFLKGIK